MGDTDHDGEPAARPVSPAAPWRLPRQIAPELIRLLLRNPPPPPPGAPEPTAEEIASRNIAQQEVIQEVISEVEREMVVDREYPFKAWRLAGLGLLIVLTIGVSLGRLLMGGPDSVAELRERAGVDTWSELRIGVKDDQYGTAYHDPVTGIWSGFDIDIAYMVAEDLGFRRDDVRFFGLESEDRARMQAAEADGTRVAVQLVIASYSITSERQSAGVRFSQPYLYTEQSVITLKGHQPVVALTDLKDQKVCTLSTSTSESALSKAGAIVTQKNRVRECFAALDKGDVEAISTDAAILAGWKHRFHDKFEHWDLGLEGNERWGINVGENPALEKLVNLTLYRSWADPDDRRWEEAFETNLQTETDLAKTPIAVGEQPPVVRPDVRWLPWEDPLR